MEETSATQPTTPPTSEPAQEPVERRTEATPRDDDELDVDQPEAAPDVRVVRPIAFPVLGTVQYGNDWGNCRDGCTRRHQGTDLIGVRMQPLLAAVDGTVTRIRYENVGTAGSVISITGADGWYYNYFHVNNDTPGTDDGLAGHEWQISPQLTVGSTVRAGQVIGYMGDSGNAEGSVPHLHFEIRQPDRTPVNPYHSLAAAQAPETCLPIEDRRPDRSDRAVAGRRVGQPDRRPRPLVDRPRRAPVRRRPGSPQWTAHRCGLRRRNAGAGPDPGARRDVDARPSRPRPKRSSPRPHRPPRPPRRRPHRWCRHR